MKILKHWSRYQLKLRFNRIAEPTFKQDFFIINIIFLPFVLAIIKCNFSGNKEISLLSIFFKTVLFWLCSSLCNRDQYLGKQIPFKLQLELPCFVIHFEEHLSCGQQLRIFKKKILLKFLCKNTALNCKIHIYIFPCLLDYPVLSYLISLYSNIIMNIILEGKFY